MLKKAVALFAALLFVLTLLPAAVSAEEGFDMGSLHARYVILVDAENPSETLFGLEQNADTQCATGSTIKILSCIVALENGNPDDLVTISANATDFSAKNSLMGIQTGEQWTLRDLLYGMMLPSGNDAAVAIAEQVAGSTSAFAELMNQKAAELGMTHSHFVTVNGRDNSNHYSTARDMAILTAYALKNEEFCRIVGTGKYTCTNAAGNHTIELINTNRLIVDQVSADGSYTPKSCLYADAIGVKTGDTNAAGKCFIGAAKRGGTTLIAVVLGGTLDDEYYQSNWLNMKDKAKDPYNAQRFEDAIALFDYAFKQMSVIVTLQDLIDLGLPVSFDVQIQNYDSNDENNGLITASPELDTTIQLQLMKPFFDDLRANIGEAAQPHLGNMGAPVKVGDVVGTVDYTFRGVTLFPGSLSLRLMANRAVEEGILRTEPVVDTAKKDDMNLFGATTGADGNVIKPQKKEPGKIKTVLIVAVIVLGVAVLLFAGLLIAARIRREKRRKALAARRRRQKMLEQQRRRTGR